MSALARRSALVLGLLFGLLFAVGTGLLWRFNLPVSYALVFAAAVVGLQYLLGPVLIDWIYTIRWTSPESVSLEFAQWFTSSCESGRVQSPRFGIIQDGNPNAFTYGRTRGDARIVVTSGLIDILTPDELRAVVAHEIGHVAHRDFIVMTVAQAVPLALYILYVWSRRRSGNYGWIVAIGAYLVYILSTYIVLVLSRLRESFADERSAHATRDPNALATALVKISYGLARAEEQLARAQSNETADEKKQRQRRKQSLSSMVGGTTTAMGISSVKGAASFALATVGADGAFSAAALANAIRWELLNPWARWFELHSTHPLTGRRVRALGEAARELGISPVYDSTSASQDYTGTGSQYTGNFLKEFLIYALPLGMALAGFAAAFTQVKSTAGLALPVVYALIGYGIGRLIKTAFIYPGLPSSGQRGFNPQSVSAINRARTVEELVGQEINVSHIKPVPCIIEGEIIGRGIPGLSWSHDLVLKDSSGFMRLQYRQPFRVLEFLFGLFKADSVIGRQARVYGWYRRAPSPYVEISHVEMKDSVGARLNCYYRWGSYGFALFCVGLGLVLLRFV